MTNLIDIKYAGNIADVPPDTRMGSSIQVGMGKIFCIGCSKDTIRAGCKKYGNIVLCCACSQKREAKTKGA